MRLPALILISVMLNLSTALVMAAPAKKIDLRPAQPRIAESNARATLNAFFESLKRDKAQWLKDLEPASVHYKELDAFSIDDLQTSEPALARSISVSTPGERAAILAELAHNLPSTLKDRVSGFSNRMDSTEADLLRASLIFQIEKAIATTTEDNRETHGFLAGSAEENRAIDIMLEISDIHRYGKKVKRSESLRLGDGQFVMVPSKYRWMEEAGRPSGRAFYYFIRLRYARPEHRERFIRLIDEYEALLLKSAPKIEKYL